MGLILWVMIKGVKWSFYSITIYLTWKPKNCRCFCEPARYFPWCRSCTVVSCLGLYGKMVSPLANHVNAKKVIIVYLFIRLAWVYYLWIYWIWFWNDLFGMLIDLMSNYIYIFVYMKMWNISASDLAHPSIQEPILRLILVLAHSIFSLVYPVFTIYIFFTFSCIVPYDHVHNGLKIYAAKRVSSV